MLCCIQCRRKRQKSRKRKGEKQAGEIESAERKTAFWRIQQSAFLKSRIRGGFVSDEAEDAALCCLKNIARKIALIN